MDEQAALGKLISSRTTYFQKRVFPVMWFGIIIAVSVTAVLAPKKSELPLALLLIPIVMALFGYALMRLLIFDLVDAVYDCGDHLLICSGNEKWRVPIENIMNIGYSGVTNPKRITLTIRAPTGQASKDITFMPPHSWVIFAKHPLVTELIQRVDATRPKS